MVTLVNLIRNGYFKIKDIYVNLAKVSLTHTHKFYLKIEFMGMSRILKPLFLKQSSSQTCFESHFFKGKVQSSHAKVES
jgi:hypothetical protein